MKKLVFLSVMLAALCMFSCSKKTEQSQAGETATYQVDELMSVADSEVGKEIELQGLVSHVCRHSGKKCFLANRSGELTMQVMAGGSIEAFDQALKGSEIKVKGVLKEGQRITKEEIVAQEQAVNEEMQSAHEHKSDGSFCNHKHNDGEEKAEEHDHKHCQARLKNLQQMQDWMAKNNKDYYALYYVEAVSFKPVK